jgi:hypothetical protein
MPTNPRDLPPVRPNGQSARGGMRGVVVRVPQRRDITTIGAATPKPCDCQISVLQSRRNRIQAVRLCVHEQEI